jgi:hypothetical protein
MASAITYNCDPIVSEQPTAARQSATPFLLLSQNSDGGWGYAPGQHSIIEPSAAAALALRNDPEAREPYEGALAWIRAAQHRDGGWGLNPKDAQSSWQTAWALLALAYAGVDGTAVEGGTAWLLTAGPAEVGEDRPLESYNEIVEIDGSLRGWPWRPGQASWVEPTALSMLALRAMPSSEQSRACLDEAVAYLQDRRCRGGGWNVGNPMMFGKALPARAHPTAWALLALVRTAPQAIFRDDQTALLADMDRDGGALALAWGLLALAALGTQASLMAERLVALQAPNGSWNDNPYHTATAIMVLRGGF